MKGFEIVAIDNDGEEEIVAEIEADNKEKVVAFIAEIAVARAIIGKVEKYIIEEVF